MRIALCDDEGAARREIRSLLSRCLRDKDITPNFTECSTGSSLLEAAALEPFDLVFLDIYLKSENGIEVAHALRDLDAVVPLVFLTVSRDFAVESYDVQALDYLLKPLELPAVRRVVDRIAPPLTPRLSFRVGSAWRYFPYGDIVYVESRNHAVLLHCSDGECYRSLTKLDDVQEGLSDTRFLRCHRSCIVNMDYVVDVEGDFVLKDGNRVPVRVKQRRKIHDEYRRYFIDKTCSLT